MSYPWLDQSLSPRSGVVQAAVCASPSHLRWRWWSRWWRWRWQWRWRWWSRWWNNDNDDDNSDHDQGSRREGIVNWPAGMQTKTSNRGAANKISSSSSNQIKHHHHTYHPASKHPASKLGSGWQNLQVFCKAVAVVNSSESSTHSHSSKLFIWESSRASPTFGPQVLVVGLGCVALVALALVCVIKVIKATFYSPGNRFHLLSLSAPAAPPCLHM